MEAGFGQFTRAFIYTYLYIYKEITEIPETAVCKGSKCLFTTKVVERRTNTKRKTGSYSPWAVQKIHSESTCTSVGGVVAVTLRRARPHHANETTYMKSAWASIHTQKKKGWKQRQYRREMKIKARSGVNIQIHVSSASVPRWPCVTSWREEDRLVGVENPKH